MPHTFTPAYTKTVELCLIKRMIRRSHIEEIKLNVTRFSQLVVTESNLSAADSAYGHTLASNRKAIVWGDQKTAFTAAIWRGS